MDQSNVHQLLQFIYHFNAEINTDHKETEHSQKNLTVFLLNILFSPRKIKVLLNAFSKEGGNKYIIFSSRKLLIAKAH